MTKKLTDIENAWKQPFLHDLFEAGGLLKRSVRSAGSNCIIRAGEVEAAKTICNEIKFRNFNFPKTDEAIRQLSRYIILEPLHERSATATLTEEQIANIIAAFCTEKEIYWDDVNTLRSTVEMDVYKLSYLGKACFEFGCFLSQHAGATSTPSGTETPAAPVRKPRVAGSGPKSGYKSSGPRSAEILGLLGKPGEKIILPKEKMLCVITCKSTKPKKQYVFSDPVEYKAPVNKVKCGDPSGYTTCKLFFDSIAEAQAAITKITTDLKDRIPSHVTGFEIKKQTADPNGYFMIDTEVGHALIKASKLNEAINEAVSEKPESHKRKSRFPEINDIDTYCEAMFDRE